MWPLGVLCKCVSRYWELTFRNGVGLGGGAEGGKRGFLLGYTWSSGIGDRE